jgi:alpha-aminoadipate carrier protein LysW
MATCAACEADMDVDEFDVDRGDLLSCPQCGANLEVIGLGPVELEVAVEEDVDARETDGASAEPDDGDEGFD